ncbi:MAG: RluA family pseudouridine synthase [Bacteroidota bacterium]
MPDVLFEDNHLIAVNKPAGLLVQGDETGDTTLSDIVKAYIAERYQKPGAVFLGTIHRIDRPVSGLVVFARTSKALTRMNELFRSRDITKRYLAVVEGRPAVAEQTLVHWLTKNEGANRATAYKKETPGALRCELNYRVLGTNGGRSLVEVQPLTGRSHQIRCQLAAIGCPITGDLKYGAPEPMPDKSICLHARSLSFIHPVTKVPLTITAPAPGSVIWHAAGADVT